MKKTDIFTINGMHCTACALNIDGELEDTAGIYEATTNYAKQHTVVEYDPKKISPQQILEIIGKTGYAATLQS
jgi:Cu+-exporting ATPase